MDKVVSSRLIDEIRAFLKEIGADEGVLFGSRARGDELEDSDVDLIVISDKFQGVGFSQRLVDLQRKWKSPLFLEALPYTSEELEKLSSTRGVVAIALRDGIRIKAA